MQVVRGPVDLCSLTGSEFCTVRPDVEFSGAQTRHYPPRNDLRSHQRHSLRSYQVVVARDPRHNAARALSERQL
jgi:hypothetical protein